MSEARRATTGKLGLGPEAAPRRKLSPKRTSRLAGERVRRTRKSSAASLLRHATGWAGNDFEKRLKEVQDLRGESVF